MPDRTENVQRYMHLAACLMCDRALAGGELSADVEDDYNDKLEMCWDSMTEAEQDEIERMIKEGQCVT
jgi:hypothetical protein